MSEFVGLMGVIHLEDLEKQKLLVLKGKFVDVLIRRPLSLLCVSCLFFKVFFLLHPGEHVMCSDQYLFIMYLILFLKLSYNDSSVESYHIFINICRRGSGGRGFISGAGETEIQLQRHRYV